MTSQQTPQRFNPLVTNIVRPAITGTGENGATVVVLVDADGNGVADTVIGTPVVDGDGNWGFTPGIDLVEGVLGVVAYQIDLAGNMSDSTRGISTVTIDLSPPDAPVIDTIAPTNDTIPEITGTGEVGATVTLLADTDADGTGADVQIGQTVVDGDGNWSIISSATLPEGHDCSFSDADRSCGE